MRPLPALIVAAALGTGGCGYFPVPPDPIRYDTSPAEVSTCRKLGSVGLARTDGAEPVRFDELTVPVRIPGARAARATPPGPVPIFGPNFAIRLQVMRDAALALGATDLLLARRRLRDWSYVEGIAYRCPR